jgi:hypothetical protein
LSVSFALLVSVCVKAAQRTLIKSTPDLQKVFELSKFGTLTIFLDPVQSEIMKDKHRKQMIIGPASTGKTLLIQLKVLEII